MPISKRSYIVDLDNTILDTDAIKSYWTEELKKRYKIKKSRFLEAYQDSKKISGVVDVCVLSKLLGISEKFFFDTKFQKFLFKNSLQNLQILKTSGTVIIFSLGNKQFQQTKVKECGIEQVVGEKNIVIVNDKTYGIKELLKKLHGQVVMIDDASEILEEATRIRPDIITIWVRYGRYKNRLPIIRSSITIEVGSFDEGVSTIEKLISTVSPPESHIKFPVYKGITRSQIKDLIWFTKNDKKILAFTHDDKRFKNIKSFSSWLRRGKTIYTLTNRSGKLVGVVWFAKKKFKNISYTFAIRIYRPMRGKGLSNKFMKVTFGNFMPVAKYPNVWLSLQANNNPAYKTYKKFGFEEFDSNGKEKFMVLKTKKI